MLVVHRQHETTVEQFSRNKRLARAAEESRIKLIQELYELYNYVDFPRNSFWSIEAHMRDVTTMDPLVSVSRSDLVRHKQMRLSIQ